MGGLGKMTLARYVYNDEAIKSHFDVKVWVCVSADYDMKRITKDILESVSDNCGDIKDMALGSIQTRLCEKLRNKKFLLVLDDIWNESYSDWQILKGPFNEGLSGSKIIVTTRSKKVAIIVKTADSCIEPNFLSEEDCWSLLCTHANLNPNRNSIEKAGKEIAKKCSGLPLAAMIVGGMLRDKWRVEEWVDIQNSMTWALQDVMSVLKMSYYDLTPQLKRCFAFCSLFPEDYEFKEEELVLLWIGAGLILTLDGEKSKKEVAHDCFCKLLSKSFFLAEDKKGEYGRPLYVMHNLVRELAQQVSLRKTLCVDKDDKELMIKNARHLGFKDCSRFQKIVKSIIQGGEVTSLPLRTVVKLDYLRYDLPKQMDKMFLRLKYVRALSLKGLGTAELPEAISKMKLLRYLDLSDSYIQTLPASVTTLYNLEILILRQCYSLKQLPEKINRLIHLWSLDISDCANLEELLEGIKELERLEKLTHFIVDEKLSVASLGNWKHLRGSLEVSALKNVVWPEEHTLPVLK